MTFGNFPMRGRLSTSCFAARAIVSALTDLDDTLSLSTSGEIRSRVAQCSIPRGLMDKVPAACLIREGQVVSRVKDVDHSLVFRENAASGWEEDGLSHFFAGKTVDVLEPGSRAARVRLRDGFKRIDFLPVGNESVRQRRVELPHIPIARARGKSAGSSHWRRCPSFFCFSGRRFVTA